MLGPDHFSCRALDVIECIHACCMHAWPHISDVISRSLNMWTCHHLDFLLLLIRLFFVFSCLNRRRGEAGPYACLPLGFSCMQHTYHGPMLSIFFALRDLRSVAGFVFSFHRDEIALDKSFTVLSFFCGECEEVLPRANHSGCVLLHRHRHPHHILIMG